MDNKLQQSPTLRLVLYTLITLLATLQDKIGELVGDSIAKFNWFDWFKLIVAIVLPTLITIRAFIDQSISRDGNNDQITFNKSKK